MQPLADYNKMTTPVSKVPESVNWWQNRPKYMTSFLKAYFGKNATKENDFGYGWLPKGDVAKSEHDGDYSFLYLFDKMTKGEIKGGPSGRITRPIPPEHQQYQKGSAQP